MKDSNFIEIVTYTGDVVFDDKKYVFIVMHRDSHGIWCLVSDPEDREICAFACYPGDIWYHKYKKLV